jgi:hypothetical protein
MLRKDVLQYLKRMKPKVENQEEEKEPAAMNMI